MSEPENRKERTERYRPARGGTPAKTAVMVPLFIILLVSATAGLGFLLWQQMDVMSEADERVADLQAKVAVLEEEMRVTEQSIEESGEDTEQNLSFWESEIRKLWVIGNERNKQWIDENRAAAADAKLVAERVEETLEVTNQSIEDLRKSILTITRQQQGLSDQFNTFSARVASDNDSVKRTVEQNKEAISAIDASRAQNNTRILELERRVRNLSTN